MRDVRQMPQDTGNRNKPRSVAEKNYCVTGIINTIHKNSNI